MRKVSDIRKEQIESELGNMLVRSKLRKEVRLNQNHQMQLDLKKLKGNLNSNRLNDKAAKVFHGFNSEPFLSSRSNSKKKLEPINHAKEYSIFRIEESQKKREELNSQRTIVDTKRKSPVLQEISEVVNRKINYFPNTSDKKSVAGVRSISSSRLIDETENLLSYCKKIIKEKDVLKEPTSYREPKNHSQSDKNDHSHHIHTYHNDSTVLPVISSSSTQKIRSNNPSHRSIRHDQTNRNMVVHLYDIPIKDIVNSSRGSQDKEARQKYGVQNAFELFPRLKKLFKDSVTILEK